VHRTLDQCAFDIEKLVLYPIQRCAGMRTAVAIGETFTIAPHHKAIDLFAVEFDRKSVTAGIFESFQRADQQQIPGPLNDNRTPAVAADLPRIFVLC
jgi:hypothetical protein